MSKEQLDLLYYMNKVHQLEQLLEQSEKENKRLKRLLAELSFTAKGFLSKLERI
jgi:predicted transcriptional regulator